MCWLLISLKLYLGNLGLAFNLVLSLLFFLVVLVGSELLFEMSPIWEEFDSCNGLVFVSRLACSSVFLWS